jgi:hypothetical protein
MGWPVFRPFSDDFPTSTAPPLTAASRRDTANTDACVATFHGSNKVVGSRDAPIANRGVFLRFGERSRPRIVLASNGRIMPDSSDRSMTSE